MRDSFGGKGGGGGSDIYIMVLLLQLLLEYCCISVCELNVNDEQATLLGPAQLNGSLLGVGGVAIHGNRYSLNSPLLETC